MKYSPEIYHRKSIRLKNYDYSLEGLYFITICCQNREHLFGEIVKGKMILNNAGFMIQRIYEELPKYFEKIEIGEYVIMPNHFHCVIEIVDLVLNVGAESISAQIKNKNDIYNQNTLLNRVDIESTPTTIPNIIQTFKRYTTIEYIKMVKNNQLPNFDKRIWQKNYYEHIIRNEEEYTKISKYIENNPTKWDEDKYR